MLKVAAASVSSFPLLCLLLRVFSSPSASFSSSSSSSSLVNFKLPKTPPFRCLRSRSRESSNVLCLCPSFSSSFFLVNARPFPNPPRALSFGEIGNTLKRSRFNDVNEKDEDKKTTRIHTEERQQTMNLLTTSLFVFFFFR